MRNRREKTDELTKTERKTQTYIHKDYLTS